MHLELLVQRANHGVPMISCRLRDMPTGEDFRDILREKAAKHRQYYQDLVQMDSLEHRQRRSGVFDAPTSLFGEHNTKEESPITQDAIKKLADTQSKLTLLLPPPSGYCSSASDDDLCNEPKVHRYGSSDSAMGQSDEDASPQESPVDRQTAAVLPVPGKMLVEARYLICDDDRRDSIVADDEDPPKYRYFRTPSVVVSDYSDDHQVGLSLEEVEYMRTHRSSKDFSSPDSSLHSSCSNLNYCGSSISAIDAEYILQKSVRKSSDCSTCSTLSEGDDDDDGKREPSGWRKLRNIVQWTPFFQTYKKQRYPWVQLAGHQGNFKAGPDQGTILKKLSTKEELCFKALMDDSLRPFVPEFRGLISSDDGDCTYIQLQDLLGDFVSPCVMDCKIGVRTYLEEELAKAKEKPKLRKDMYEKMCQVDVSAPTEEEHRLKGVTKPRYMVWRETISSTATLGFRIEGVRRFDGTSSKDFKTTRTREQIVEAFVDFLDGFPHALPMYLHRLKAIKRTLESSSFFSSHEMIGSSLLFVHDRHSANVWLIDFAKTVKLPDNVTITHSSKWQVGNHEDGYMTGLHNIIHIFMTILEQQPVTISPPLTVLQPTATDDTGVTNDIRLHSMD